MDALVARQAIFDRHRRVYGYELLFRSTAGLNAFDGTEGGHATRQVLANSLLVIGLENLVGTKKAFVNFGRGPLLQGWHASLPRENTVIELLETVEPDAEVLAACRKLREEGYQIALDDFVFRPGCEALLDVADLIKIEIQSIPRPEQKILVRSSKARGLRVLAEKVETYEEFEWARLIGYDYFQGYFFARPVIITGTEIRPVVATCLQLLRLLQSPEFDFKKLEGIVAKDMSLTYKLFRYVNSVMFAHHGNIQSIRRALIELGEDGVRRWVTIAALPRLAQNKPAELVNCALVRAQFSENLARLSGDPGYSSSYLTGMFSLLDALLDRPLAEALEEVGLDSQVKEVLLGTASPNSPLARIHTLAQAYEAGQWEQVRQSALTLGLSEEAVSRAYVESTEWANEILQGLHISQSSDVTSPAGGKTRKERRQGRRDAISGSIAVVWGASPQEECVSQASLVDVSAFGAKFRLTARIPAGSWLMFNHHKAGISGRGTVRYCRMVKSSYEIGVHFSGGTGWNAASNPFGAHLRNLSGAIDRLQAVKSSARPAAVPDVAADK